MEKQDKIDAVNRYVEAFQKKDIGIIKNLYAADATLEDPVGTDAHVGIDAIVAFYEAAMAMDVQLTLTGNPRCVSNAVAFPFAVKAPDMTFEVIDVFEFNDEGKVSSMKAYWG